MSKRDYYDILGVGKKSTSSEIKKSYRKLAMKYHPDKNHGDVKSEDKFKEIKEAYEVLSDDDSRRKYDRFGHIDDSTRRQDPFSDIFGDIFGNQRQQRQQPKGNDVEYSINITLKQSVFGDVVEIKIPREHKCVLCDGKGVRSSSDTAICRSCNGSGEIIQSNMFGQHTRSVCNYCNGSGKIIRNPCMTCRGEGYTKKSENFKVNIVSGIFNGERLKYSRQGFTNKNNGVIGDLYINVGVLQHDTFVRDNLNLICKLDVGYTTLCLGGKVNMVMLNGKVVKLSVSSKTNVGKMLRLKGMGVKRGNQSGDILCEVNLKIPVNINSKHEKILRSLSKFE
jgi:molecular chaperone DnaJ